MAHPANPVNSYFSWFNGDSESNRSFDQLMQVNAIRFDELSLNERTTLLNGLQTLNPDDIDDAMLIRLKGLRLAEVDTDQREDGLCNDLDRWAIWGPRRVLVTAAKGLLVMAVGGAAAGALSAMVPIIGVVGLGAGVGYTLYLRSNSIEVERRAKAFCDYEITETRVQRHLKDVISRKYESTIDRLQNELGDLEARAAELENLVEQARQERRSATWDFTLTQEELRHTRKRLDDAVQHFNQLKGDLQRESEGYMVQLNGLRAEKEELLQRMADIEINYEENIVAYEAQLQAHRNEDLENKYKSGDPQDLKRQLDTLRSQLQETQRMLDEEHRLNALDSSIRLDWQLGQHEREKEADRLRRENLERLEDLTCQLEEAKAEIAQLRDNHEFELLEKDGELDAKDIALNEKEAELEALRDQLATLEDKLKSMRPLRTVHRISKNGSVQRWRVPLQVTDSGKKEELKFPATRRPGNQTEPDHVHGQLHSYTTGGPSTAERDIENLQSALRQAQGQLADLRQQLEDREKMSLSLFEEEGEIERVQDLLCIICGELEQEAEYRKEIEERLVQNEELLATYGKYLEAAYQEVATFKKGLSEQFAQLEG